jgi:general secretion pathway protein G
MSTILRGKGCGMAMIWRRTGRKGFTFLEIMFVVVIIGILLSILAPRLVGKSEKARVMATKAQMNSIKTALQGYEMHIGAFPSTSQGLKALFERPSDVSEDDWDGPYLDGSYSQLKDAWGHEFTYKQPGEHSKDYDLFSKGHDNQEGTDDDIINWVKETQ